jgi:hypothetical protein
MTLMLVALIVELFYHDPSKNVPFTQVKSLIRHVKLFLFYFNAWRVALIMRILTYIMILMICSYLL